MTQSAIVSTVTET